MGAVEPIWHDMLTAHGAVLAPLVAFVALLALLLFVELVAAMRVMEISSGTIGSMERAKESCTGPRTWPQLMPVDITAPKLRTSKKF